MDIKSTNGWLASEDKNEINVKNYIIAGTDRHFSMREEVAPVLGAFLAEFHKLVEPIDVGTYDDWGHYFRAVRGMTKLSNHSSGTAIDVNATKHGLGLKHTFKPEKVKIIQSLLVKYGLGWGGNYRVRKDDMHFEIIETPAQVKARIASMKLPVPKVRK